jgi:tetratricopeptide (TPR) repeat protein
LWHDGYLENQKSDRNTKLLLAELEREPDNAYLLYQLAVEYSSLQQTENAFQCLQKAFGRIKHDEPFAPNIVVDLLYVVMALKKFDAGTEVIAKSEGLLEDFPDFHLVRGLFYMNLIRSNASKYVKELPKIEQSFQRCLALGETDKYKSVRGSGSFLANYNLGVFYHAFGNGNGAKRCFETAVSQGYEPAAAMLNKLKP